MGDWEKTNNKDKLECEIPECTNTAALIFLPAFESPGGWSGDHQEYDPKLDIAFVCDEHQPERHKEAE